MNEIPKDASFANDLQYVYVVVLLFRNEQNRPELTVWTYKDANDAQKRFERLMEIHNRNPTGSSLILTETFMSGVYDNFEQSLFTQTKLKGMAN